MIDKDPNRDLYLRFRGRCLEATLVALLADLRTRPAEFASMDDGHPAECPHGRLLEASERFLRELREAEQGVERELRRPDNWRVGRGRAAA